jgi:hypothetical protein
MKSFEAQNLINDQEAKNKIFSLFQELDQVYEKTRQLMNEMNNNNKKIEKMMKKSVPLKNSKGNSYNLTDNGDSNHIASNYQILYKIANEHAFNKSPLYFCLDDLNKNSEILCTRMEILYKPLLRYIIEKEFNFFIPIKEYFYSDSNNSLIIIMKSLSRDYQLFCNTDFNRFNNFEILIILQKISNALIELIKKQIIYDVYEHLFISKKEGEIDIKFFFNKKIFYFKTENDYNDLKLKDFVVQDQENILKILVIKVINKMNRNIPKLNEYLKDLNNNVHVNIILMKIILN